MQSFNLFLRSHPLLTAVHCLNNPKYNFTRLHVTSIYSSSVCVYDQQDVTHRLTACCCYKNRLISHHRVFTDKPVLSYLWQCGEMFPETRSTEPLATSTSPGSTWCHSACLPALKQTPDLFLYLRADTDLLLSLRPLIGFNPVDMCKPP